jgi:hypothetical protein
MLKALGTLLRWIFTPFIALLLLFEEWGWEPLAALVRRMSRLPVWAWCERKIAKLSPWEALLVLVIPAVALFPIKLAALYFIRHGQLVIGMSVLIGAKLLGTALVARLFQLTEPALMQFGWFAKWYPRWKVWKDQLMDSVRASALWQIVKRFKSRTKAAARATWRRFFRL